MMDVRDDARAGFERTFGYRPIGLWSAPGRVNLIGEHTDYNEGFVLPFAIDRRTVVAVGVRPDRMIRVATALADEVAGVDLASLADAEVLEPGLLGGWSAYPLGVAWALGRFSADLAAVPGVDLFIESDVPVGAGLSSSAALESAVALALNEVWRLGFDRPMLARVGQRAENDAVGAPTGIMDQSAALLGRPDCAVFLDCRSLESDIVPLGFQAAGLELVVIDTGVGHDHATGGYADRRASCASAATTLGVRSLRELSAVDLAATRGRLDEATFRRVRHVITENDRVLEVVAMLRHGRPHDIGMVLDASHRSMRDDFEISTPELDLAVETAGASGALGARMTGGGFGGAAIALIPHSEQSLLRVAIDGAFAEHGYRQPDIFVVTASGGATRDD